MKTIWMTLALTVLSSPCAHAQMVEACGSLKNNYGPFDYTNVEHLTYNRGYQLYIVERAHFNSDVEAGIRGQSTYLPAGDISYTLRAWPNHHRALLAMARLALRDKTERPKGSAHTMDCWFERAHRNAPHDGMVPAIYATYLAKRGRKQEVMEQGQLAYELTPDSKNVNYNLAVAYFEIKEYELAKKHAMRAEELGHPFSGVKNQLQKLGKW